MPAQGAAVRPSLPAWGPRLPSKPAPLIELGRAGRPTTGLPLPPPLPPQVPYFPPLQSGADFTPQRCAELVKQIARQVGWPGPARDSRCPPAGTQCQL